MADKKTDAEQLAGIQLRAAKSKSLLAGGCALIAMPFLIVALLMALIAVYVILSAIF